MEESALHVRPGLRLRGTRRLRQCPEVASEDDRARRRLRQRSIGVVQAEEAGSCVVAKDAAKAVTVTRRATTGPGDWRPARVAAARRRGPLARNRPARSVRRRWPAAAAAIHPTPPSANR